MLSFIGAAAVKGALERGCIGEGDTATAGQTESDTTDGNILTAEQSLLNIVASGLAFDIVGERENKFAHLASLDASLQTGEVEVFGANPLNRGKFAVQDMVSATKIASTLHCHEIGNMLDNADKRPLSLRVVIDSAALPFADIARLRATMQAARSILKTIDERAESFGFCHQQVQGDALSRAVAETRQLPELAKGVVVGGRHGSRILTT